jgi:hypothetical protein
LESGLDIGLAKILHAGTRLTKMATSGQLRKFDVAIKNHLKDGSVSDYKSSFQVLAAREY